MARETGISADKIKKNFVTTQELDLMYKLLFNKNTFNDFVKLFFIEEKLFFKAIKQNLKIKGIPIIGSIDNIEEIIVRKNVDQIVIAIPSIEGKRMRILYEKCRKSEVEIFTLPSILINFCNCFCCFVIYVAY